MKKHLTPSQVREIRVKEAKIYNEKYIWSPLRFFGWILFWIFLYFWFFEL